MKIYTSKKRKKERKVTQFQFLLRYEETTRKTHRVSQAGHRTLSVSEVWEFLENAPLNFVLQHEWYPYYLHTHRKLNHWKR
jgi:hypothetical protein